MTETRRARGATAAVSEKLTLAALPYELQANIWEAAIEPQIIFMDIVEGRLGITSPADKALARVCSLSREIYTKKKKLLKLGAHSYWVDPDHDIFYFRGDRVPSTWDAISRPSAPNHGFGLPTVDGFDRNIIQNVAVDLYYLGSHPREHAIVRLWILFPGIRSLHILVPKGPPGTPVPKLAPETVVLSDIPNLQIVGPPDGDAKELWLAVRYQVKRACNRILSTENGWMGRHLPEVVGHLTDWEPETAGYIVDSRRLNDPKEFVLSVLPPPGS
ncbi:hypothetical protein N657DRAFT_652511 [Parathielavia appendiculata]|uniref:2EXR domain-containing protein n=1 Tax=Parathielavia appendiculata TaxID=2587402 RepID=A0AAN6UAC2_9PEZI|nr:hypothetical protein N657DRAFT_652511 [Parathielavia appendiculata]